MLFLLIEAVGSRNLVWRNDFILNSILFSIVGRPSEKSHKFTRKTTTVDLMNFNVTLFKKENKKYFCYLM